MHGLEHFRFAKLIHFAADDFGVFGRTLDLLRAEEIARFVVAGVQLVAKGADHFTAARGLRIAPNKSRSVAHECHPCSRRSSSMVHSPMRSSAANAARSSTRE